MFRRLALICTWAKLSKTNKFYHVCKDKGKFVVALMGKKIKMSNVQRTRGAEDTVVSDLHPHHGMTNRNMQHILSHEHCEREQHCLSPNQDRPMLTPQIWVLLNLCCVIVKTINKNTHVEMLLNLGPSSLMSWRNLYLYTFTCDPKCPKCTMSCYCD